MRRRNYTRGGVAAALAVCLLSSACAVTKEAPRPENPAGSASRLEPIGSALVIPPDFSLGREEPAIKVRKIPARDVAAEDAARRSEERQEQPAFSFADAVRQALDWHPSLDVAAARLNQRVSEIDIARAGYYPQVNAGIDTGFDHDDRNGWQPDLNVTASQMIYDFGKVASSVQARSSVAEASRARLLLAVDEIIRDAGIAFVEVQRSHALLELAQDQIEGVQSIAALVQERSRKGATTRSDEVQADARVRGAEATLLEISAQLRRWESTLASLVGAESAIQVDPDVPEWLIRSCEAGGPDWPRVPAIMEAEALRNEALAQLDGSRADLFPTLSLETSAGYDLHERSLSGRQRSRDQPEFFIGLRVSANLYNGGADLARRHAASQALSSADASIRNARFEITRSLLEAREQVSSLNALLVSLASRDSMVQQTRDLYRRQYIELGTRTLLDLLNAEQELHQARFSTANTIHDLRRLGVQCLYSSGRSREAFDLIDTSIRGAALQESAL